MTINSKSNVIRCVVVALNRCWQMLCIVYTYGYYWKIHVMSWHNMKLCIILQTVSQAMQGVDILIAVVSTSQLNWVYWEIFECMIEDNLMESCTVILKLVDDQTVESRGQCITANNALQNSGFVGDKWKGNACKCFSCDKMHHMHDCVAWKSISLC